MHPANGLCRKLCMRLARRSASCALAQKTVYHRNNRMSVCVISDARDHEKNAVAAFSTKFLHFIKEEFSSVESVDIWTEGSVLSV